MSVTPINHGGVSYPTLRAFCESNAVGYHAMLRLCRKYVRARRDPSVAAAWILGEAIPVDEPVTMAYRRDTALGRKRAARQYRRSLLRKARDRDARNRELLDALG